MLKCFPITENGHNERRVQRTAGKLSALLLKLSITLAARLTPFGVPAFCFQMLWWLVSKSKTSQWSRAGTL